MVSGHGWYRIEYTCLSWYLRGRGENVEVAVRHRKRKLEVRDYFGKVKTPGQ